MDRVYRRRFMELLGAGAVSVALGLTRVHIGLAKINNSGIPNEKDRIKPLEEILNRHKEIPNKADLSDGWYIQYAYNQDPHKAKHNKLFLLSNGFNNVKHIISGEGTKTLIGNYSSMEEAVQNSERLAKISNEVGIVEIENGNPVWRFTAYPGFKSEEELEKKLKQTENKTSFQPYKKFLAPITKKLKRDEVHKLVLDEVRNYNESARYKLDPNLVMEIIRRENADYDPKKVGYKLVPVPNNDSRTRHIKPYIFVHEVDKKGRLIPTAYGLTMITSAAMKEVRINTKLIFNPRMNLRAGIKYLGKQFDYFKGDARLALAAYNAGPRRVAEIMDVPKIRETQDYLETILRNYKG